MKTPWQVVLDAPSGDEMMDVHIRNADGQRLATVRISRATYAGIEAARARLADEKDESPPRKETR